jgi:hypothetical protein
LLLNNQQFEQYLIYVLAEYDDGWVLKKEILDCLEVELKGSKTALFSKYISLLKNYKVESKGHINNPSPWNVILENKETENAFYKLMDKIDNINLDKLALVTSLYYENGDFRKKLENYLNESARLDYVNYDETNIKYKGLK